MAKAKLKIAVLIKMFIYACCEVLHITIFGHM